MDEVGFTRHRRSFNAASKFASAAAAAAASATYNKLAGAGPTRSLGTFKLLKTELRVFYPTDIATSGATIGVTGRLDLMNNLSEGTAGNNRTGRDTQLMWLDCHLRQQTSSTAVDSEVIRYIYFIDTNADGAAPAVTDVLITANSLAAYNADNVWGNRPRFRILKDFDFEQNSPGVGLTTAGTTFITHTRRYRIKVPYKARYKTSNAGTISDIVDGSLYLLSIATQGDANVSVAHRAALGFKDA